MEGADGRSAKWSERTASYLATIGANARAHIFHCSSERTKTSIAFHPSNRSLMFGVIHLFCLSRNAA
jgi:hypothetical protein